MQHPKCGPCCSLAPPPPPASHHGPAAAKKAEQEAVQDSHLLPPSTAVPSVPPHQDPELCPNRAPSKAREQLESALWVGGISFAVPMAQNAPVGTEKQIQIPHSTGIHLVSPLCRPTGTSPHPGFTDGALCILHARGILFQLEAPVNPALDPC